MEKEKTKRSDKERKELGVVIETKKKRKKIIRKEEETSEKEVEEFFAILKRMRAVVKYFEKGGAREGWRAAVEAERPLLVEAGGDDDCIGNDKMRKDGVEENGVFDLNAAPEAEDVEEDNPIS